MLFEYQVLLRHVSQAFNWLDFGNGVKSGREVTAVSWVWTFRCLLSSVVHAAEHTVGFDVLSACTMSALQVQVGFCAFQRTSCREALVGLALPIIPSNSLPICIKKKYKNPRHSNIPRGEKKVTEFLWVAQSPSPTIQSTTCPSAMYSSSHSPLEVQTQGTYTKHGDVLASALILSIEPSCISEPRVLGFLMVCIKLWQANLLACSEGPCSNLSQSLTTKSERKEQHGFEAQDRSLRQEGNIFLAPWPSVPKRKSGT